MRALVLTVGLAAALAGWPAPARAQAGADPPEPPANGAALENGDGEVYTLDPDSLPVDIDRIQRKLSRPPAIRPETTRLVFRVQVFGRNPTIDEILGPDWRKGPTPGGVMSHSDFLSMVTPKDVQGYAMYDNKQAVTVAATSFALQWALRAALKKLDDARTERQEEAARREVNEAMAALRKARRDAGLPDL